jgi:ribosome-interacting GTPase 1
MPTNLPPDYFAAGRYRAAETSAEKIACLEEMLSLIPRHKGTEHLVGDLRHRLAKLKASAQVRKKTGRQESAWHFDREGVGQVVVVGPTNVGKSALVEALTNASPEVSAAPLTTWRPTPGMMPVENVQIHLIPAAQPRVVDRADEPGHQADGGADGRPASRSTRTA